MKTKVIKKSEIVTNWYIIDAKGVRLGKLATVTAGLLIGKNKVNRASNMASGDAVVIINASEVDVHKTKLKRKKYVTHSTYRGGYKEMVLEEMLEKTPEKVIELAVTGMLPKTKLRSEFINNLYVYAGSEHQHEAQKPVVYEVKV